MSCTRQDYLQCLKFIIKTMRINPIWLIFRRQDLILEKKKGKMKKRERYNNLVAV